jgi:hypothetical protein
MRKAKVRPFIPTTDRVREFRARAKRNGMLVTIEVQRDLPDALVDSGFLQEWDSENPAEIRKAIERVLAQLIADVTALPS